jgi:hypothetical protein
MKWIEKKFAVGGAEGSSEGRKGYLELKIKIKLKKFKKKF